MIGTTVAHYKILDKLEGCFHQHLLTSSPPTQTEQSIQKRETALGADGAP